MSFRHVVGGMYAIVAIIFLCANSYILGAFGHKFAHDDMAKLLFAVVAGAVPWALAPHLHVMAARNRAVLAAAGGRKTFGAAIKRNVRMFLGMIPFLGIYVLFVGYNVLGGTGATAFSRAQIQDERQHVVDDTARKSEQRRNLQKQLDGIPKHRAPDAVEAELKATRLHPFWARTENCKEGSVRNKAQRDYCSEIGRLEAEIRNGKEAKALTEKIEALDTKLEAPARAISSTDPQIAFLSNVTGLNQGQVLIILLLATPLILEAGALYWGKQALELLGMHLEMAPMVDIVPPSRQIAPVASRSQVRALLAAAEDRGEMRTVITPGPQFGADPRQMRAILDEFWGRRMRRMEGSQVPELTVFEHYRSLCAERAVAPFSLEQFRNLSASAIPSTVIINGAVWYAHLVYEEEAL